MTKDDYQAIEEAIGYRFRNRDLLQQAFVRRSYSNEHGGENNEILEFIGDKALDLAVVRKLTDVYGWVTEEGDWREFACELSEGQLTEKKRQMVERRSLAGRIRKLGLAQYLITGRGDNSADGDKAQEDLLEAILGAVAIDCQWNLADIMNTVEFLLEPDSFLAQDVDNYVELIQIQAEKLYGMAAEFVFTPYLEWTRLPKEATSERLTEAQKYYSWGGLIFSAAPMPQRPEFVCCVTVGELAERFLGCGMSKAEARKDACCTAYHYMEEQDMLFTIADELNEDNDDNPVGQLETLARKDYIPMPAYEFQDRMQPDGRHSWKCTCRLKGDQKLCYEISDSKKEAKKQAAYRMLEHVLENY